MVTYLTDPEVGTIIFEGDAPSVDDLLHYNDLTDWQRPVVEALLTANDEASKLEKVVKTIKDHIAILIAADWAPNRVVGDNVVRPNHYDRFPIEPTFYNQMVGLDWCRGNALKYLFRYPFKNGLEDLKKAARYIEMYIKYLDGDPEWSK